MLILYGLYPLGCGKKYLKKYLKNKIVVCSIYHFDGSYKERNEFIKRDKFVNFYHVISENTKTQISHLTDKSIQSIPFWVNNQIFFNIDDKKPKGKIQYTK